MGKLFGTDGVRGVANTELTAELAFNIGRSGARVLAKESRHKAKILIGKDTRISCDMLEAAIIAGICSTGADAVSAGVIPTPAIAYLTALYGADAGIVISASHNSFEFNGIKFFDRSGYKLPDAIEEEIEELMRGGGGGAGGGGDGDNALPTGAGLGRHIVNTGAEADYTAHLLAHGKCDLSGVHIAIDCANGAAYRIAPTLFEALGGRVSAIHNEPDGTNINAKCGSTRPEAIRDFTIECGADVGLAFDGDADRVLAVDEKGGILDGDAIMALLAIDMKNRGALRNNTVVATVMSNIGFEIALKKHGINLVRSGVGDRYVLEEMLKRGCLLGGENSGHIICLDENTTGDGLFAALRLMKILFCAQNAGVGPRTPVSALAGVVKPVPQIIRNAKVSNELKHKYMDDPVIRDCCSKIEDQFCGEGRVLIRPSGTEPLIRVMIESNDRNLIETEAEGLAKLIEQRLAMRAVGR